MEVRSTMTLPKYARWLASKWTRRVAFVIALGCAFLWPHADLTAELVLLASIPGVVGLVVFGLTFWQKARIQIGRLQLRYRRVRLVAGLAAVICLLVPFARYLGLRVENHFRTEWSSRRAQYYRASRAQYHFVVAFTHLDGDQNDRLVAQLMETLGKVDSRLAVSPTLINHTIAISGDSPAAGHLQALGFAEDEGADVVIWGRIGPNSSQPGPMYMTDYSDETPFSGAYLPTDFKLPDLPVEVAGNLLQLIVASRSAAQMGQLGFDFGDALEPSIKQVQAIADDSSESASWSGDTRARVDFALGVALRISAFETNSQESLKASISMFQKAFSQWTREANPLEWAMTELNLGMALRDQHEGESTDSLHKAIDAYRNALAVYQSRTDKLDTAAVQYEIGWTLEAISDREGNAGLTQQAIEAYRAASLDYDHREHPWAWAAVQVRMAGALGSLARLQDDPALYRKAIETLNGSLEVYERKRMPRKWLAVQFDIADYLAALGKLTRSRKDLRDSIAISRDILDSYPRYHNALVWASAQSMLGEALGILGQLDSSAGELQQAGTAYQAALSELSAAAHRSAWARAQDGLADTYLALGEQTNNRDYLNDAVNAYGELFKVYTRQSNPSAWAWTKNNQGWALYNLSFSEGDAPLKDSIDHYREALSVLSKDKDARQRQTIQTNLDEALKELQKRGG